MTDVDSIEGFQKIIYLIYLKKYMFKKTHECDRLAKPSLVRTALSNNHRFGATTS